MQKAFFKIEQLTIDFPHGLSIGLARVEPVKSGWVVKIKGLSNFDGEDGHKECFFAAIDTTMMMSVWKDGETELWDVIEVFDNEDEATLAGKENEQMSIYQIETGKLKWIV